VTAPTASAAAPGPIAWKTVTGIKSGPRPLLAWVADPVLHSAAEKLAFDDADVRLASRAFRLARISPANALADPILSRYARSAPMLVAFVPDLSSATLVAGASLDPSGVLQTLRPLAATYLRLDLDASISRARTLIAEQRALSDERTVLAGPAPADVDVAQRTARIAEIDARLARIPELVAQLFRPLDSSPSMAGLASGSGN
jgi:hypothetical protein